MLSAYSGCVDSLLVVSRTGFKEEGKVFIEGLRCETIINPDETCHNYHSAINHLGQEGLGEYDELVLTGDVFFGPLYPLEEMFSGMEGRGADFWTLTKHSISDRYPYPYTPLPDISGQTHMSFICFRKNLFTSRDFQDFWDMLPAPGYESACTNEYMDVIDDIPFFFEQRNYKGDTFITLSEVDDINPFSLLYAPKILLEKYHCPILDIRVFFVQKERILENTAGEAAQELLKSLPKSGYDTGQIWSYLIRAVHPCDFVDAIGLYYILPAGISRVNGDPIVENRLKTALCMHIYYLDMLDDSLEYAKNAPKAMDVFVTTPTEAGKKAIEAAFSVLPNNIEVRIVENRGRNESALLVCLADVAGKYDFICFFHDKKTNLIEPNSIGRSNLYKLQQNTLPSREFAFNVIDTFLQNERLGILCPVEANHAFFSRTPGNEWALNYVNVMELYGRLGLTAPVSEEKYPVAPFGSVFWFRCAALRTLFEEKWGYEDFPPEPGGEDNTLLHAIERIYPYVAQSEGYYPAYVMSDSFAVHEISNLRSYLRGFNELARRNGIIGSVGSLIAHFEQRYKRSKKEIAGNEYLTSVPASLFIKKKLKKLLKKEPVDDMDDPVRLV